MRSLAAIFALAVLPLVAETLDFGNRFQMPDCAISLPKPIHCSDFPPRMPVVRRLRTPSGKSGADCYRADELWLLATLCGQWKDDDGNFLTIAKLSHRPPAADKPYLTWDEFRTQTLADSNRIAPKDRQTVIDTVFRFLSALGTQSRPDRASARPVEIAANRAVLADAFQLVTSDDNLILHLVRPAMSHRESIPHEWLLFVLELNPDKRNLTRDWENSFRRKVIEQIARIDKTEEPPLAEANNPLQAFALRSIRYATQWRGIEEEDFVLLTDIRSAEGQDLAEAYRQLRPHLQNAFFTLIPPFPESENRTDFIRIVSTKEDYVRYLGDDLAWTAGVWLPLRRELVLSLRADREQTLATIRHESFHQYLSWALDDQQPSVWFNEGHASLFQHAKLTAQEAVYSLPQSVRDGLDACGRDLADRLVDLLHMDYATFYSGNPRLNYALAHAIVHYIQFIAPENKRSVCRQAVVDYLKTFHSTHHAEAATRAAFRSEQQFADEFVKWWNKFRNKRDGSTVK
ncbi:MAG: hypothetical protein ACI4X9_02015 [Kiritimatiellia bacterium]